MKEYYKIGEISDLYGIGTDSLRYYEEIGVLSPKRDLNGYRMYSIKDIRTLNILRELRSIGFSMAEIKNHLKFYDLDSTLALFKKEIDLVKARKKELTKLEGELKKRISDITASKSLLDQDSFPLIKQLPDRKILTLNENVYRDEDVDFLIKKLQNKSKDTLTLIGNGHIGATMPIESVSAGDFNNYNSVFYFLPDGCDDYDTVIPCGRYLCYRIRGDYSVVGPVIVSLLNFAKENGLTTIGNPMEIYLIDNHDTGKSSEYLTEIQIAIV